MHSTASTSFWRGQITFPQRLRASSQAGDSGSEVNTPCKNKTIHTDIFQAITQRPRFGQTNNTISDTSEIELKGLVRNPNDLNKIKKYFNHSGYYIFSATDGGYSTAYFDTPDNSLLRQDYCLRIRKNTKTSNYNDLSIKTPVPGKDNLYRHEYEAVIPEVRMDLAALRKLGGDANNAVNQVLKLCNGDPFTNLKEKVYSECRRSRFRVLLYIHQAPDGQMIITPERRAKNHIQPPGSKRAVYEAALDQVTFFTSGLNGTSDQKIGEDCEVEWELKQSSASERDKQPVISSPALTEEEALAGMKYLQAETNKAASKIPINWGGQSKQSRGLNYLGKQPNPPAFPPFLTAFGKPVSLITFGQALAKNSLGRHS